MHGLIFSGCIHRLNKIRFPTIILKLDSLSLFHVERQPQAPSQSFAFSIFPASPPPAGCPRGVRHMLDSLTGLFDTQTGIFHRTRNHPRLRIAQAREACWTRKGTPISSNDLILFLPSSAVTNTPHAIGAPSRPI